jgi:hypothetical protein
MLHFSGSGVYKNATGRPSPLHTIQILSLKIWYFILDGNNEEVLEWVTHIQFRL